LLDLSNDFCCTRLTNVCTNLSKMYIVNLIYFVAIFLDSTNDNINTLVIYFKTKVKYVFDTLILNKN